MLKTYPRARVARVRAHGGKTPIWHVDILITPQEQPSQASHNRSQGACSRTMQQAQREAAEVVILARETNPTAVMDSALYNQISRAVAQVKATADAFVRAANRG